MFEGFVCFRGDEAAGGVLIESMDDAGPPVSAFGGELAGAVVEEGIDQSSILIAGSGMCSAGRFRHHLKHGIWDPKNTVLFVGYQAPGTLGRILLDGAEEIKMMGLELAVKAEIARIGSFSAHADRDELTNWLMAFKEKPDTVFLIHGELDTLETFSASLKRSGFNTAIPVKGVPVFPAPVVR